MIRDTAYLCSRISNIDNTQEHSKSFPKKPYKTRNFVYYDLN